MYFFGWDDGIFQITFHQRIRPRIEVYTASQDFPKYQGFWSGYYEVTSVPGCQIESSRIFRMIKISIDHYIRFIYVIDTSSSEMSKL